MKTSELTGAALDWAVAKCEGLTPTIHNANGIKTISVKGLMVAAPHAWIVYSPRTDWAQGGPIIERVKITVAPFYERWVAAPSVGELIRDSDGDCMTIAMWQSEPHFYGPTPLIAAMRCRVASKLGDEVEVPVELLGD